MPGRFLLPLVLLLHTACAGVEWHEHPDGVPQHWRGLTLHTTDDVWVLAREEAEASHACELALDMIRILRDDFDSTPRRGLIVALSDDDEPLVPDDHELAPRLEGWYAEMMGMVKRRDENAAPLSQDELEATGLDRDEIFKLWPTSVSRTDPRIGLPPGLTSKVDWVVVMPTLGLTEDVVSQFVDVTIELANPSFGQTLIIGAALPWMRGQMANAVRGQALGVMCFACARAAGLDDATTQRFASACVEDSGLMPSGYGQ